MQNTAASPPGDAERGVLVQHRVQGFSESWLVGEEAVPEAAWHDAAVALLQALLRHWVVRTARDAAVFRNLAVRIRRDQPRVGFDPDLLVVEPAPPGAADLSSLRLWEAGHVVPSLVVEVVSPGHPYKDYTEIPDQCAALGVRELLIFDPLRVGPRALGGPSLIQVWRRTDAGTFARVACGEGPFASVVLGAYIAATEDGRQLRFFEDAEARRPWPTAEESERAAKEAEGVAREAALARVAELERELDALRGRGRR